MAPRLLASSTQVLALFSWVLLARGVTAQGIFLRGDSNQDKTIDISDPISTLLFLSASEQAPVCLDALDADDDGEINVTDVIVSLDFLFRGASPPPEPGPAFRGLDPTADTLDCLNGTRPESFAKKADRLRHRAEFGSRFPAEPCLVLR